MKFKDLRSITTLLKEYGMKPGTSTPVGNQQTGSIVNKTSSSPTVQGNKAKPKPITVNKVEKDTFISDPQGKQLGKIVSPVGDKPVPDAVVVQDEKGEYSVVQGDEKVIVDPEMEEGKLGSFVKKARNKSLGKLKKSGGLRRLGRRGLKENPSELFEINFNNKDVIQNSLDAQINCGFEAETVWPNVDYASDDPDNLSFSELVDAYEEASDNEDYIWESHSDWVREKAYDEFLPDIVDSWVEDNLDNYDLRMEFANDNIDDQEIEDHKDEFKAENPEEYKNRIEDGWDMDNWTSELIDLNYEDDFKEWLNDMGREDDTLIEQAVDEAESEWDIDYWCNEIYGSPAGAFREIADIYFDTERKDVDGIADVLYEWIRDNSKFTDYPETGGYGDTDGGDIWAVEHDGSITGSGAHGEIISPVYSSPRLMLEEMKSLFEFMQKEGIVTNSSTGLHITMSWAGDKDIKTNKIKAIVLSGVDHVVNMFGRKGNSYTKLRMPDLKRAMEKLKDGSESQKSIEQIEDILSNAINTDRTMAINFKGAKDPVNKNSLLEFRAAGGRDYHQKISDVVKTVVRYSATMVGSHTEEYNRDYVRALIKTINTIDEMPVDDIERAKQGTSNDNHPLVLLFQSMLGKHAFLDGMREIYVALNHLDEYNKLSQPDAEKKWKSSWDKFKKHSGKGLEYYLKKGEIGVVKEAPNSGVEYSGSIPAMMRPPLKSPTEEAKDELRQAQKYFKIAMGKLSHDVAVNLNRSYINAKSISVLRKAIKEFQLTEDELANAIVAPTILQQVNFTNPDAREDNKLKYKLLSKGIHRLLKREKLVKDRYFLTPQMADRLIDGLWNYLHSGKATENGTKKILNLLALARQGEDQEESQDFVNAVYDRIKDKREYNEFFYELENGKTRGAGLLEPNSVFNKEPLDKLLGFLKKFPEYSYPVSPKHNVNIYSDDDYTENFLKQLSIKVRRRLNHIRTLKDDNLALYFDIVEKLGKLITNTYKDLSAIDVKLGDEFPNLVGTDLENENDGKNFLGLYFGNGYMQDRMQKMLDKFATRNYATDEDGDDVVAEFNRFYDSIRDLLNSYSRSKKDNPKLYAFSPIPELIKSRMGSIKKFLKGIDKISVKDMGFDSAENIIKAKADISKQEKEWKKKHGPKFVYEIDDFDFGGDVWINKDIVNDIIGGDEKLVIKTVAEYFEFDRSKYVAQYGLVRRIPTSHYYIAEEAQEIYDNPDMNLTWRKPVATKILEEFNRLYKTSFRSLDEDNVTLQWNEGEIIKTLKKLNVGFTKDLGDGREGMKGLGDTPILPREEINGPYGEPFERSSASAWRANNPELAKKAEAEAEKLKKNMSGGNYQGIIVAAGVEGMEQSSSNEIANKTNWLVLSNHLKIKSGVDQQGANLLKKVYNMYDSNNNWRPDGDPNACCMPRYIAAVRAAKEYIEKNYIESGGNYFRKNADGSIGDDVSAVHGNRNIPNLGELDSVEVTTDDYAKAREKYPMFDVMMQSGVGSYIVSADTNRLVKLLVGDFSEKYKQAVIKALIQNKEGGGEPADMQQALALGYFPVESVFAKFDKLPLQEKLSILEKSTIIEKWSKKYKDSINCSNPKGFSQKAHCAGKKKTESSQYVHFLRPGELTGSWTDAELLKLGFKKAQNGSWYIANSKWKQLTQMGEKNWRKLFDSIFESIGPKVSEGPISESLPDNSIPGLLNQLLAEPMPAWDLKKQFLAYYAVPDPQMLTDFRARRAEGGKDACLRSILRHYIKLQLHPQLQKKINLNESVIKEYEDLSAEKEKIIDIIKDLDISDNNDRAIVDQIWRILNSDHIQEIIGSVIARPIADETAMNKAEATKVLTKVIYQVESEYDKIKEFLDTLENTGSAYDVDALKSKIGNIRNAFVSDVAYTVFKTLLPYGAGSNKKGPGEFALAMLSDRVKLSDTTGDIVMDDELVELKVSKSETTSSGGRLGMNGISQKDAREYIEQYRDIIPTVMAHLDNPSNKSLGFPKFIEYLNVDLPIGDAKRYEIAKGFYSKIFSQKSTEYLARSIQSDDISTIIDKYYVANFNDYKSKGQFGSLLAIDIATSKTMFIDDITDLVKFRKQGLIGSPSLSFVPTQSGPTEVFVQMSFTKK